MTKKQGRPSDFSEEIADEICELISEGKSLRKICQSDDMPSRVTVNSWLKKGDKGEEPFKSFLAQYVRSREEQADYYADEMIEIADESSNDTTQDFRGKDICNNEWVNRSKLRVDARKWLASKLRPKRYGDRTHQEISGPEGKPVEIKAYGKKAEEMTDDELMEAMAKNKIAGQVKS
jgi:hypothetical protein